VAGVSAERIDKEMCLSLLRTAAAMKDYDMEASHSNANDALIAFLRHLGHDDVADLWRKVEKWYA
jgi:hypothetical protein